MRGDIKNYEYNRQAKTGYKNLKRKQYNKDKEDELKLSPAQYIN